MNAVYHGRGEPSEDILHPSIHPDTTIQRHTNVLLLPIDMFVFVYVIVILMYFL